MKYFDNRYKKREKLVALARRLRNEPYHTKKTRYDHGAVIRDITDRLYKLFPVYRRRYSTRTGEYRQVRVTRKACAIGDHPIIKAC